MRRIYIDGDPVKTLQYVEPHHFYSIRASAETNKPDVYTIEGEYIVLGGRPDSAYSGQVFYYRRPASFSSDSDDNNILINKTGLYLYAASIEAANFIKDNAGILRYTAMWEEERDRVSIANKSDRHSGSPLIVRSNVPIT